jgi:hypothetical protein
MTWQRLDPAPRRVVALVGSLWLAVAAPATSAAPPGGDPLPDAARPLPSLGDLQLQPPGFEATPPPGSTAVTMPGPTPWRAVGEEALVLGVCYAGYRVVKPPANGSHPVSLRDKLTFAAGAWGFDADRYDTNYVGHPWAGLVFYQVARGNRLGVGASLGLTLASAWAWELAETEELASIHDVISSTAGGFALGEAFGQLADWFRQREGGVARVASVLFQLPRAFHDWRDDAPPAPQVRWRRADVSAWISAGASWPRPRGDAAELRLGGASRLIRTAEVGERGAGWLALPAGDVTSLIGEVAVGRPGVVEADFLALASLAGLHGRDLDAAGDGHDLLATLSLGYDYLRRAEPVDGGWANDGLALLRVPGVELVASLRRGEWRAELGLEAALTLGGVVSLPLLGRSGDLPGAPGPMRIQGYYHGVGGMVGPRASLAAGPVSLRVAWRGDRLRAVERWDVSPPPGGGHLPLEDERRDLKATLEWRIPSWGLRLFGSWERRNRWGRAGAVTAAITDSTAMLGVAVAP